MAGIFQDLFTYDSILEPTAGSNDNRSYINCTMLKPIGKYKEGDRVNVIAIQATLYIWDSDSDYEEECLIL